MSVDVLVQRVEGSDPSISLPEYKSGAAAGMDICASLGIDKLTLKPYARLAIPTGLRFEIPNGFEGQIRPRSGLAVNHGVTLVNAPGTIDSDYRGEVKVILINLGESDFEVKNGQRIAQMVIAPVVRCNIVEVAKISMTQRGESGFGSTGN